MAKSQKGKLLLKCTLKV